MRYAVKIIKEPGKNEKGFDPVAEARAESAIMAKVTGHQNVIGFVEFQL